MKKPIAAIIMVLLAACSEQQAHEPVFFATENPAQLSDWGMLSNKDGSLSLGARVTPYDLATPLFSDYALKLRTIWLPENEAAEYNENSAFGFPVGTVITKTFYYPRAAGRENAAVLQADGPLLLNGALSLDNVLLVETRILVHRTAGWDALAYVWNDEQTEAELKRIGDIKPMTLVRADGRQEAFSYLVPNANQCAGCHATNATTREIQPIGLKARHLNKPYAFGADMNQLDYLAAEKILTGLEDAAHAPRNADWRNENEDLDLRARAYLDANCSHCHNPVGPADTSGLNLEPDATGPALGLCKTAIAAGGGTGGRPYGITPGAPERSILLYRMETTDPGAMMPELGRSLTHEEGVALISTWIENMEGECS